MKSFVCTFAVLLLFVGCADDPSITVQDNTGSPTDSGDTPSGGNPTNPGDNSDDPGSTSSVTPPSTAVNSTIIPAGDVCAHGGVSIDIGIDENGNGILDTAEIDETVVLCSPAPVESIVTLNSESAGENCAAGGVRIDSGFDDDLDGTLDSEEIDDTEYVCNGEDGEDGTDNSAIVTIGCSGGFEGEPLIGYTYDFQQLASGDVVVQASIYDSYVEVSKTQYWDSLQNGAENGAIVLTYDLAGAFNYGFWSFEIDRDTLIISATYQDSNYNGGDAFTWVQSATDCTLFSS